MTNRRGEMRDPMAYVLLGVVAFLLVGGIVLIYWLQGETLEARYGEAAGSRGMTSVNGAGVLGGLFREAGHRVSTWPRLSPTLYERADTIVWFPSDSLQPSDDVINWLEGWLLDQPGRTLIYVSRDFDAEAGYWKKIAPGAPPHLAGEIASNQAKAASDFTIMRSTYPSSDDWTWFTMAGTLKHRAVTTLEGEPRWLTGVDASKAEIELNGRLVPPEDVEILLESQGDALVWREDFSGSQLIVVANGSFLLNFQLVNHEHRKLAASLVREIGPEQHVVFLEAAGNPTVSEKDPEVRMPTSTQFLEVPPFDGILLHLAVVGIIFCFCRWPVFGRRRHDEIGASSGEDDPQALAAMVASGGGLSTLFVLPHQGQRRTDFGEHVTALGNLLQITENKQFCTTILEQYRQRTRHDPRQESK